MDWRAIFANELKTEPAKGDNEAINHMVQLIFDLRKQERVSSDKTASMQKENEMLRHEILLMKQQMAKQQQSYVN